MARRSKEAWLKGADPEVLAGRVESAAQQAMRERGESAPRRHNIRKRKRRRTSGR